MMDIFNLPPGSRTDVQVFNGSAAAAGTSWQTWVKKPGITMCTMFLLGGGGNGGTGAIGAVSTAAGGGGGGSSGQTVLTIPAMFLPDVLYVSVGLATIASRVAIHPDTTVNNCLALANAGSSGGNASGATAGTAGASGAVATLATMPLAGAGQSLLLVGQGGVAGATTIAATSLNLPVTGLLVTGACGGGGLPASGNGLAGGAVTGAGQLPGTAPGAGATSTTTPPGNGGHGMNRIFRGLAYNTGGGGGGSTHATATGGGLVQSSGGDGGIGCGGGGCGGALTGSTAGVVGRGGPGQVIIIAW